MLSFSQNYMKIMPTNQDISNPSSSVTYLERSTDDQAHSREFSEDAYQRAAEPKELAWVRGAGHVDLYDRVNLIPWIKLTDFFTRHLRLAG